MTPAAPAPSGRRRSRAAAVASAAVPSLDFTPLTEAECEPAAAADAGQADAASQAERSAHATRLVAECRPVFGTPAARYLERRGIGLKRLPPRVAAWHGQSHAILFVARDGAGAVKAVQRVYLAPDGTKANVEPVKRTNGVLSGTAMILPGEGNRVLVTEGPEDALSLWQATGLPVRCAFGVSGLGDVPLPDGAAVVLVADNDAPEKGTRAAVERAGLRLHERGHAVAIARPPAGLKDANDLLLAQGPEAVRAMVDAAVPWESPPHPSPTPEKPDTESELARLAALSPIEYDRCREAEAERLGVRVTTLDSEVKRRRPADAGDGDRLQGRPLELPEPEPWHEPVDGAAMLTAIADAFARYVALPEGAADAVTLWCLHAHALDAAEHAPRLAIVSPTPGCGKSTLLRYVGLLVPRPLSTASVSPAALFRTIERARPTLLIDEADAFMSGNGSEELRGLLNAGHGRTDAHVIRTVGEDFEPRMFSTWAALAIARIGRLPATLMDRSIVIPMRRRRPSERIEHLRSGRPGPFDILARKAARWSADHLAALREADPEDMPPALGDRAADNFRPLVAIADRAGGDWPERARKAAALLSAREGGDQDTIGIVLLADIRAILENREGGRITSAELAAVLAAMEDRPWPEWKRGKPITPRQIAKLLAPFGIAPKTVRTLGERAKGYVAEDFQDIFARYLPSDPCQRDNPQETAKNAGSASVTKGSVSRIENGPEARNSALCHAVTDRNPPTGSEGGIEAEEGAL
jgi:putative DNA primase/helicase